MYNVSGKRYKVSRYALRHEKDEDIQYCDLFLTMFFVLCSACMLFLIFSMLRQNSIDETVTESLLLVRRLDAKILKVRGDRIAMDRAICEIREDLAKVYELINASAGRKNPQKRLEPTLDGKSYVLECEEQAARSNSDNTTFACEIARMNGRICEKFLKEFRATKKNMSKTEVSEVSMSDSSAIIRRRRDVTNGNYLQNNKSHNQSDESDTFPKRIRRAANENPPADDFWYHYAGDAQTSCKVPNQGLKTAEILCKIWPQSISCNTYCVYGSTYPEGIVRSLNCSFHQNRWSDYFEECQPFVNCKLYLVGPGTLKCIGNQVNKSPSCHIGCEDYEDKEGTPARMYDCKADGTWAPPLPPCVSKKSGVDLVTAPTILEHKSVDYPKMKTTK